MTKYGIKTNWFSCKYFIDGEECTKKLFLSNSFIINDEFYVNGLRTTLKDLVITALGARYLTEPINEALYNGPVTISDPWDR